MRLGDVDEFTTGLVGEPLSDTFPLTIKDERMHRYAHDYDVAESLPGLPP